jgi:hypothetical protein
MDIINFKIVGGHHGNIYKGVSVYINGRDLIDIVDKEKRHASIKYYKFLDHLEGKNDHNRNYVLGCGCGDVECRPFGVKIEKTENSVIWRENCQPMPTFIFDLQQYNEEIEKLSKKIRKCEHYIQKRKKKRRRNKFVIMSRRKRIKWFLNQ